MKARASRSSSLPNCAPKESVSYKIASKQTCPEIVLTIHNDSQLRKAADAPFVLRQIKDFYELNSLPVPSEISGILNEAPRNH